MCCFTNFTAKSTFYLAGASSAEVKGWESAHVPAALLPEHSELGQVICLSRTSFLSWEVG